MMNFSSHISIGLFIGSFTKITQWKNKTIILITENHVNCKVQLVFTNYIQIRYKHALHPACCLKLLYFTPCTYRKEAEKEEKVKEKVSSKQKTDEGDEDEEVDVEEESEGEESDTAVNGDVERKGKLER